jgi:DedD protein
MADPIADNPELAVDELKRKARRRLIGAIVLALAAATLLPLLLEQEQKPLGDDVSVQIPPVDDGKFVNRLTPGKVKDAAPDAKVAPKSDAKIEPRADAQTESTSNNKVDAGAGAKPEAKAEPKVEAGSEAKAEPKADTTAAASTGATTEAKAGPLSDAKPAARSDAKVATRSEAKVATKSEAKAGAKSETKTAAQSEAQSEPTPSPPPAFTAATISTQPAGVPAPTESGAAAATAGNGTPAEAAPKVQGFVVQLGAFTDTYGANALANRLKKAGYPAYTESIETSRGTLWRVRVGGYPTRAAAAEARGKLKADGQNGIVAAAK